MPELRTRRISRAANVRAGWGVAGTIIGTGAGAVGVMSLSLSLARGVMSRSILLRPGGVPMPSPERCECEHMDATHGIDSPSELALDGVAGRAFSRTRAFIQPMSFALCVVPGELSMLRRNAPAAVSSGARAFERRPKRGKKCVSVVVVVTLVVVVVFIHGPNGKDEGVGYGGGGSGLSSPIVGCSLHHVKALTCLFRVFLG